MLKDDRCWGPQQGLTLCEFPVLCRLQVYLCSASPPVRYPNVYGVDMPTRREFVATNLDVEQIREVSTGLLTAQNRCSMSCRVALPWASLHEGTALRMEQSIETFRFESYQ